MSQFRADESAFDIKAEADDDSQESAMDDVEVNDPLDDDEDMPIAQRRKIKREISDDEEDMPLTARKIKTEKKAKKVKREPSDDEDDYDKPKKKKIKKEKVSTVKTLISFNRH